MAGLSLKVGGYGGAQTGASNRASQDSPSTISEAAFGSSSGSGDTASAVGALAPNDPFGIAHWAGLASVGFLGWLWWSLPR